MGPAKRGSEGSYSSFSSSSSTRDSDTRKYLDPWDLENAMYVRGKRISFASDPSTYSAASAALEVPPSCSAPLPDQSSCYCGYDSPADSYVESPVLDTEENLPSMKYLNFCPYCDVQENNNNKKTLTFANTMGDGSVESCEECSACSSVAPPPPLLLFSNAGGRALSAAGLQSCLQAGGGCKECEKPSFSPSPRRFSVPEPVHPPQQKHQPQLAYVYESPRARAKHGSPSWDHYNSSKHNNYSINDNAPSSLTSSSRWSERSRRLSLAASRGNSCDCGNCLEEERRGPHARLLEPPRHPCRWGMARTGHVAIDYTNAWMSLARRIKPSRT